jgi:hypothetical protein
MSLFISELHGGVQRHNGPVALHSDVFAYSAEVTILSQTVFLSVFKESCVGVSGHTVYICVQ